MGVSVRRHISYLLLVGECRVSDRLMKCSFFCCRELRMCAVTLVGMAGTYLNVLVRLCHWFRHNTISIKFK
jgi:hypothetical protein